MSHSHAHDDHSHGSVKSYLTGFVLSVILTGIPFWMVMTGAYGHKVTMIAIFVFAILQILVHLRYFLHLNFSKEGRLNTMAFIFTAMVIVLLVGLSIWIITVSDILMMRY